MISTKQDISELIFHIETDGWEPENNQAVQEAANVLKVEIVLEDTDGTERKETKFILNKPNLDVVRFRVKQWNGECNR